MPLLEKPTLDKDSFKNYHPVSNLNFLSKVTVKAVASQIKLQILPVDLIINNRFQLVYKAYHSMKTILLTVQNDMFLAMEKKDCTALTVLDLSAAIDTIDHCI